MAASWVTHGPASGLGMHFAPGMAMATRCPDFPDFMDDGAPKLCASSVGFLPVLSLARGVRSLRRALTYTHGSGMHTARTLAVTLMALLSSVREASQRSPLGLVRRSARHPPASSPRSLFLVAATSPGTSRG
jgi:hypothetical protein